MKVRFWGTRGSVPTPGPDTARYGGNTSCVELQTDDGTRIILDCGTGARALGQHLLTTAHDGPLRLHLFIGHIHWDHIQGFPFFVPAFLPNAEINIYAPRGFQKNLEESLAGQMQHSYFPVRLKELRSRIQFNQLEEGFFRLGRVLVETQHLNHTAPTIAYRITSDGATIVYSTDHEPFWKPGGLDFRHPGDQLHMAFLKNADLVIHDAQYTEAEYPEKVGWGHSTIEYATDVAVAAGVRKLALFHHDPARDDASVDRLQGMASARATGHGSALDVFSAAEGLTLDVHGGRRARQVAQLPAMSHRPIGGSSILVVGGDDAEWGPTDLELQEDNLSVYRVPDRRAALGAVQDVAPDLIIIDEMPHSESFDLTREIRGRMDRPNLPVILLTDDPEDQLALQGGDASITDYLAKPYSPPMLRSRVRAWLARAAGERTVPARIGARSRGDAARAPVDGDEGRTLTRQELREIIGTIPLFRTLVEDDVDLLTARATEGFFEPGRSLVRQGETSDILHVIVSGRVRVVESPDDPSHTEMVLAELGAGEVVGELGVLTGMPRSATVVASESVRTLCIPGGDFLRVVQGAPALATSLLQVLARRIYDTDRRLARYAPDPLTGLLSRTAFREQYGRFAAQARRRQSSVLLMLVDIKNLKGFNDAFGYKVGDEVVRTVAETLLESSRKTDLVARYGGDEFAVLFVDARPDSVEIIIRRIEGTLSRLAVQRDLPAPVTLSFGIALSPDPPEAAEDLIQVADEDMQKRIATQARRTLARSRRAQRTS